MILKNVLYPEMLIFAEIWPKNDFFEIILRNVAYDNYLHIGKKNDFFKVQTYGQKNYFCKIILRNVVYNNGLHIGRKLLFQNADLWTKTVFSKGYLETLFMIFLDI